MTCTCGVHFICKLTCARHKFCTALRAIIIFMHNTIANGISHSSRNQKHILIRTNERSWVRIPLVHCRDGITFGNNVCKPICSRKAMPLTHNMWPTSLHRFRTITCPNFLCCKNWLTAKFELGSASPPGTTLELANQWATEQGLTRYTIWKWKLTC